MEADTASHMYRQREYASEHVAAHRIQRCAERRRPRDLSAVERDVEDARVVEGQAEATGVAREPRGDPLNEKLLAHGHRSEELTGSRRDAKRPIRMLRSCRAQLWKEDLGLQASAENFVRRHGK